MRSFFGLSVALLTGMSFSAPGSFAQNASSAHVYINSNGSRLGIGGADLTPEKVKALKLKEERGAEVTMVQDDSPAMKAGLKPGDVILDFNGKPVQGWEHLRRVIGETPAGTEVKIGIWRNGQSMTLTATTVRSTIVETPGGVIDFGGVTVTIPPMPPMRPCPR